MGNDKAVRPRNSADDSQRPGGPTHKKGEASQLVSAFQAFDSTQRFFPGPYSPGKGCVGLPGLNRNLTRFDFTVFLLVKTLHRVASKGRRDSGKGVRVSYSFEDRPAGFSFSAVRLDHPFA